MPVCTPKQASARVTGKSQSATHNNFVKVAHATD